MKEACIFLKNAANHSRAGMATEYAGMMELAVWHYEAAAYWRKLA